MRTQTARVSSAREAYKECPWASRIAQVEGGYMCFESIVDHDTWKRQR